MTEKVSKILNQMKKELEEVFQSLEKVKANLVFSPAYPSFDQYDNYIARGEHFDKLVREFQLLN